MSKAPSMPLFCDAYLADTMHLSLEEHGAYLKLLMVTWRNNGQPLPDDDARMARILGVTIARWRDKLRPVLEGFFDLSEGAWRSHRLEKEWNYVAKNAAVARENGKKGGRPKSLKDNDTGNPAGFSRDTQTESTQPQPHTEPTKNPPPPSEDRPSRGDAPSKRAKAGERLKPDWQPSDAEREFALSEGLSDQQVDREAARFRDYWTALPASKGRKADWPATWRNWIRRQQDSARPTGPPPPLPFEPKVKNSDVMRAYLDGGRSDIPEDCGEDDPPPAYRALPFAGAR